MDAVQHISKENTEPENEDIVSVTVNSTEDAIKIDGTQALSYVKYSVTKKDGTIETSVKLVNLQKNEQTGQWEIVNIEDFDEEQYDEDLLKDLCADPANQILEECELVDDEPEPQCQEDSECDDEKYCTTKDYCDRGQCKNTGSPCSQDQVCSEVLKSCVDCVGSSDCQDNLFCSADTCENNRCYHSFSVCPDQFCNEETDQCEIIECSSVADCPEDDLYCNGTVACQQRHCISVPPIECPDDGLYCNGTEIREEGQSQCLCGHQGNPCAQDQICDENSDSCVECLSESDCQDQDDELFCTGEPVCILGQCEESGDPCPAQQQQCDEENNRCVSCFENNECDLGQNCYVYTCQEDGSCLSELRDCGEGQMCNFDTGICETINCQTDADCSDGNACTFESCNLDLNLCENTGEKICDDQDLCTNVSCNIQTGICEFEQFCDGLLCQEGVCQECFSDSECQQDDPCMIYSCQNGDCYAQPKNCGEGKLCEAGTGNCVEIACQTDEQCNTDNSVCTLEECNTELNSCQSAGILDCSGSDPCTIYSCDPLLGCQEEVKCPDGICNAGQCVECIQAGDCDQTDPCYPQICTINGICQEDYKCDGKACTPTGQCVNCTQHSHCPNLPCQDNPLCVNNNCESDPIDCSDGDVCTAEYCDVNLNQCIYPPVICSDPRYQCQSGVGCVCVLDQDCDDGLYCNDEETCINGVCFAPNQNPCPDGLSCVENTDRCIDACEQQGQTANETCVNIHTFSWRECSSQLDWEDKTAPCPGSVNATAKFNSSLAIGMGWSEVEHIADEGGEEIRWLEYSKGSGKITLRSYNLENNVSLYQIAQTNPETFPVNEILNNLKTDTILDVDESTTGTMTVGVYPAAYIQQGSNPYYKDIALVSVSCSINICNNWKDLYIRIFLSNTSAYEAEDTQIINS